MSIDLWNVIGKISNKNTQSERVHPEGINSIYNFIV